MSMDWAKDFERIKHPTFKIGGLERPEGLRQIPLAKALEIKAGNAAITMSIGQWDTLLQAAYDTGWIVLELDDEERPIRAYQHLEQ